MSVTNPNGAGLSLALARVPQFIDPSRSLAPQFILLGAALAGAGFAAKFAAGVAAHRIGREERAMPSLSRLMRWLTAGPCGALALRLVVEERI